MKKIIAFLLVAVLGSAAVLTGCGANDNKTTEPAQNNVLSNQSKTEINTNDTSKGKVSDAYFEVLNSKIVKTNDNENVILIRVNYTNNGTEASSSWGPNNVKAFQNKVELSPSFISEYNIDPSYPLSEDDKKHMDNNYKEVQPGGTITVLYAYELDDTTSPVDFIIKSILHENSGKVEKIFTLSDIQS